MKQPVPLPVETLDDVLAEFNRIIAWSQETHSRMGYFAALYKNITILVKRAADSGFFENKAQLEKLTVLFALRYFDALHLYRQQELPVSSPWYLVFKANDSQRLTIVQHLILSVNVHINYDLPIVCAQLAPEEKIIHLCNDYFGLNSILTEAIQEVEKGVFQLSPLISLLARFIPKIERKLLNFSLTSARCKSWECACKQAIASEQGRAAIILASAAGAGRLSYRIKDPGPLAGPVTFVIRLLERKHIPENIRVLDQELLPAMQARQPAKV